MTDQRPPWIFDTVKEAFEGYGFVPWMTWDAIVDKRWLDDNHRALLFEDREKHFDGPYFAVIVGYNVFEEGWEVTEEGAGPIEFEVILNEAREARRRRNASSI
jgi:hypothetical protein